jgi:hypothetical protein
MAVIVISNEEAALLGQNGPHIKRCDREALFKCSPTRQERLGQDSRLVRLIWLVTHRRHPVVDRSRR